MNFEVKLAFLIKAFLSLYYNKGINLGETSDFVANFENIFLYWGEILEDTIQNSFSQSRKISRQISVEEFRSS